MNWLRVEAFVRFYDFRVVCKVILKYIVSAIRSQICRGPVSTRISQLKEPKRHVIIHHVHSSTSAHAL